MRWERRSPLGNVVLAAALAAVLAWAASAVRADPAPAAEGERYHRIHVVDFEGEIEPALAAYLLRSIDAAKAAGADCLVLRIDSPGGRGDSSMDVSHAILDLPKSIHTVAWVPKEAYSGASMAALACDEIVMAAGAKLGDCQPILMGPTGITPVGEKIETVLRAEFRRFAEANGWPRLLAEKLVSKDMEVVVVRDRAGRTYYVDGAELESARDADLVEGVPKAELTRVRVAVPKDRLLTMTAAEAEEFGFVRRSFEREDDLLAALKADGATVTQVRMSWSEDTSRWLLGVTGILGALVVVCAGLTVFRGIGIATFVGVVALLLTVLVSVTADLPYGFPLLLVALGMLLLAAEAFVIPGFGVAGILGIVFTAAGFLFLSTGFTLDTPGVLSWDAVATFIGQFAATLVVAGAFFLALSRLVPSLPFARRHLLLRTDALGAGAAVLPTDVLPALGTAGTAATDLRPAGRASLAGRAYDVTSEGGFVEAGTAVRVVRVEGSRVVVRPEGPPPRRPGTAP